MTIALDGEPGAWDVASFDFLHPQMRVDPFPTFSIMREQAPVHWDGRAHWIFRYDDARSVLLGDEFGNLHMLTAVQIQDRIVGLQLDTLGSCTRQSTRRRRFSSCHRAERFG